MNLEPLKYPASRILLYANNISTHLKNIEVSNLEHEREEWMQSIKYDIEQIEAIAKDLKNAYEQAVNQ